MAKSRSQDYLANRDDQESESNQAVKLSSGNVQANPVKVSGTGGQPQRGGNTEEPQNQSRQRFKARNRQIRENRPVDLRLADTAATEADIQSELRGQFQKQQERISQRAPKVDDFLPDLNAAIAGDTQAMQRTQERMSQDFEPIEIKPIQTSGGVFEDFLKQPSREAFQSELSRQRGGAFGLNALDAAILEASGRGRKAFERSRERLAQARAPADGYMRQLEDLQEADQRAFAQGRSEIDDALGVLDSTYGDIIKNRQREYSERDVSEEIDAILAAAQEEAPEDLRDYVDLSDVNYRDFVDRELSQAEALGQDNTQRFNRIQELLGEDTLAPQEAEPGIQREALILALIEAAKNEKFEQEQAIKEDRMRKLARDRGIFDASIRGSAGAGVGQAIGAAKKEKRGQPVQPVQIGPTRAEGILNRAGG